MKRFFKLEENGTNVTTEVLAGLTTFFAMSYILFVAPNILGSTGMPTQAIFLATIISSVVSTLIMALFANVPYVQAPGLGLATFFAYTVVLQLGFSWQQALALVFLCGIINVVVTVTKIRRLIIKSIPEVLQHAIGGGIGIFVAYIGIKNAGFLKFITDKSGILSINGTAYNAATTHFKGGISAIVSNSSVTPALINFNQAAPLVALVGLILMIFMVVRNYRAAILIGIVLTTLIGIPFGVTHLEMASGNSLGASFVELKTTVGAAFGPKGMGSLFNEPGRILLGVMTIFAFSLTDIFDTIGTFIGTGKRTGIFSKEDEKEFFNGHGFKSKMDRSLFSDAIGSVISAIFGTSNVTTFVESASGISVGGRTGLTSLTAAAMFAVSSLLAPVIAIIPDAATAPALIVVGIMMMGAFRNIDWSNLEDAVPAFFASVFMAMCYSISYGIAAGFIFYMAVKLAKNKFKEVHPMMIVCTLLFVINFVVLALIE
ncbi:NCS2 family permease [Liquorilactobacillus satsumensis]|uniref:Xanthine uracil vitamin C permease n=1 Tax=Liquorilactobacillus satsumensis DSM 16230 = JCM 12392 TaxID=1423801 RepID=A0A0R1V2U8_9LACO|nr:NCS2 family permease [Liquorilactobacillus satsumensis]KRL98106.1 xanthine uracil vitamin C permease [Liquorilactobacillus satsumensis DSM 16230 = JCM 12392]MCC7667360.1 NCS2 family permease [Liquorilactobacillus satsumensis]MCP9313219.1 NCS2 family permease [Liquorilactobacillus satsumensis]MCP9329471.1 NCS2 family permease [Liquorilactobacillus satsumensis]MCP9358200.1 NCS2 family permease [Liquorilactobacillus satsumensis]